VPPNPNNAAFATYATDTEEGTGGAELHKFPAYVHARTEVRNGELINLNEEQDGEGVGSRVAKGDYEALLYVDFTGEGFVDIAAPELAGKPEIAAQSQPAYLLLSAPDFFPSSGQRELSVWSRSPSVPGPLRGQLWAIPPTPLSDTRLPANLQLPRQRFDPKEDTITAVVEMGRRTSPPGSPRTFVDVVRASTLPDDAAGVFAPGWDVAVDKAGSVEHLAAYGLGSPFPEDAKLCAALSTFWPAVAPDVYRSMSRHTGNARLQGTVAPLSDEEIGQRGTPSWDGVSPPQIVTGPDGSKLLEMERFANVDYVTSAVENRFNGRLIARITAEEYERRVLVAARVHFLLGGANVSSTRPKWLFLSFATVSTGNAELHQAQTEAGLVLDGIIYRVEVTFVGTGSSAVKEQPSPRGPRFVRLPLRERTAFFVSATDADALKKGPTDVNWGRVLAE
jgi:hypothetical protein